MSLLDRRYICKILRKIFVCIIFNNLFLFNIFSQEQSSLTYIIDERKPLNDTSEYNDKIGKVFKNINNYDKYTYDERKLFGNNFYICRYMNVDSPEGLRVRNSPDINSEKIALLSDKTNVQILKIHFPSVTIDNIKSNWVRIKYGKIKGWVFGAYLSPDYITCKYFINDKKIGIKDDSADSLLDFSERFDICPDDYDDFNGVVTIKAYDFRDTIFKRVMIIADKAVLDSNTSYHYITNVYSVINDKLVKFITIKSVSDNFFDAHDIDLCLTGDINEIYLGIFEMAPGYHKDAPIHDDVIYLKPYDQYPYIKVSSDTCLDNYNIVSLGPSFIKYTE